MKRTVRTSRATTTASGQLNTKARRAIAAAKTHAAGLQNQMFGNLYVHAVEQAAHGNTRFLEFIETLNQPPVGIEEFLDSEDFMGATDLAVWPKVRETIIDINGEWWKGGQDAYIEAVLMGSTSSGKSEIAKITTAYHLHILGCMNEPQKFWGLPTATSIVFIIQAAKPHVTKKVIYLPLRKYVEQMPWFQRHMQPDKLIESEMYFREQNIRVAGGGTDADAVLGEAIIGGVLDEINFMNIVQQSKKAGIAQNTGRAGVYDQAKNTYDTVTRRKKGRFMSMGPNVGITCVASSTRYKGDFTDKRKATVEQNGIRTTYVYDLPQYEVWPQERYSGEKFRVHLANDAADDIRVLKKGEKALGGEVIEVPIEYLDDFKSDPSGALRDVCGISVTSLMPFFRQRSKIADAVAIGLEDGLESFLVNDNVTLATEGMPVVRHGHYCKNPAKPRYVHIDLSTTGDRCGVAMVRYDGMKDVRRESGEIEHLPMATIEMAVSIEPDQGHEVDIAEVRTWVKNLIVRHGYPVKAVSYDGWGSIESRQQWKKWGMRSGLVSVDRTAIPYKHFRDALYDKRLIVLEQPVLLREIYDLEYNEKKDKVDHPAHSSKDVADAACGAFFTMLQRTSTWTNYTFEDGAEGITQDDDQGAYGGRFSAGDRYDYDRAP